MEQPEQKPSVDNPLKPTKGDRGLAAVKATLAAIPYAGGFFAEGLGALIKSPMTKRLEAWHRDVWNRLAELEQQSTLDCSALPTNEEFVSTVQHATQIAVRTHQQVKLKALRNAVLNTAAGTAPSEDLQLMFLTFVDAFTPWHLRILKFLHEPEISLGAVGKSLPENVTLYWAIGEALPISTLPEGFCEQLLLDVVNRSLVQTPTVQKGPIAPADQHGSTTGLHVRLSRSEAMRKRTTPLGDAFLAFIEQPQLLSGDS